jgi:hypothetical protein
MSDQDRINLHRNWIHSFEEDTEAETVYRPDGFPLPRARGRVQFTLQKDGTVKGMQIGRNDGPSEVAGSWNLENGNLQILYNDGGIQQHALMEVTPEKLVLKKDGQDQ